MTAAERATAPIHAQLLRLLSERPEGEPPSRITELPEGPDPDTGPADPALPRTAAAEAVRSALDPLPHDAEELARRLTRAGVRARHSRAVRAAAAELPLPDNRLDAARALARGLARHAAGAAPVELGLALLARIGEPEDVPLLSLLGLYRGFTAPALAGLDRLDRAAAGRLALAVRVHPRRLRELRAALERGEPEAVRAALTAASRKTVGAATARRIAEAARLPDLLAAHPEDPELLLRTGQLLVRMAHPDDSPDELLAHREAPALCTLLADRAAQLPHTLDGAAVLLSLALALDSGTAALLPWPPGRRAALLDALEHRLAAPHWTAAADRAEDRHRAAWFLRTRRRLGQRPRRAEGLRLAVVAGDPAEHTPVEVRPVIDGVPMVPRWFGRGPAESPERLLDGGRLRAAEEPREVRLAEAWCTAGCCGELRVEIRRDGPDVVWERREPPCGAGEGAVFRFDAAAYDAEVARAEADRGWTWPARTAARLIREGLAADPSILGRWDATAGWVESRPSDAGSLTVTFLHAPGRTPEEPAAGGEPLQFRWDLDADGRPPEAQAAAVLRRLAEENPTGYGQLCGGSRERAAELGFAWPERQ